MGPEKDKNRAWLWSLGSIVDRKRQPLIFWTSLAPLDVNLFMLVKKLDSVINWLCHCLAVALKPVYMKMGLPALFPLSEISKWEGCWFPQSITKNYAPVCALDLGELSWEECTSVSSLPFPTQGAACLVCWGQFSLHDFNLRWPLLYTRLQCCWFVCLFHRQMVNI